MALTPMMAQYFEIKEKYKDCILMYRLGDFYEMFYDDAKLVSQELDLTLTARNSGQGEKAPMCGVPYHAVNQYLSKLVEKGYKIAICEQSSLTPPKGSIVEREVVRVVTAGTLLESDMLEETKSNFVMGIAEFAGKFFLSWCDISVGDIFCWEATEKGDITELSDMILEIAPAEIIAQSRVKSYYFAIEEKQLCPPIQSYYEWAFNVENGKKKIKKQLGVSTLDAFEIKSNGIYSAVGSLLEYIEETQKKSCKHIDKLTVVKKSENLKIDLATRRNLEIFANQNDAKPYGSILWLLSKTQTSMGARALKEIMASPIINPEKISKRQDVVEGFVEENLKRDRVKKTMSCVKDIERIAGKISFGNAMPPDLVALSNSLALLPQLKSDLLSFGVSATSELANRIELFESTASALAKTIDKNPKVVLKDGGYIADGFSEELDELRSYQEDSDTLKEEMQQRERDRTQIKNLKIKCNRVFGYYIEVSKQYESLVPIEYIRKQTVAGNERYFTQELKDFEEKVFTAKSKSLALELEIYKQLLEFLQPQIQSLQKTATAIARIDVLLAFALVSRENGYVRPKITTTDELRISGGRHPIVELLQRKETFVTNDTLLNTKENRTIILTGPNMAGKSTYMRQIAIITYLAHLGCFVPAKEAIIPICDRIFTRIGASDNLAGDQSTFMVEMVEVSGILQNATEKSLVILDEVGRGTSTMDGLSIAFAVTKYINEKIKSKTIFATHYHELTELEEVLDGVKNFNILVKEQNGKIVFLRKIVRGEAGRSFGIEVAALAGLPKEVLKNSKKILKDLESVELTKFQARIDFDALEKAEVEEITPAQKSALEIIESTDLEEISPRNAYDLLEKIKSMLEE